MLGSASVVRLQEGRGAITTSDVMAVVRSLGQSASQVRRGEDEAESRTCVGLVGGIGRVRVGSGRGQKVRARDVPRSGVLLTVICSGTVDFNEFLSYMAEKVKAGESPENYVRLFRTFDREGKGFISIAEFRHVMTELGDSKLTAEDADELIAFADLDT